MDAITIISAACSIIGAICAVLQARKARGYRDEILHDRRKMLLVESIGTTQRAREECRKLITPAGKKPVRGIDPQAAVDAIRDLTEKIRDNAHRFDSSDLLSSLETLHKTTVTYSSEKNVERRYEIADSMYNHLSIVIGQLSQQRDEAM